MKRKFAALLEYLRGFRALISPEERKGLVWLLVLNCIGALIETCSVFSIMPFLAVAAKPDIITRNRLLDIVYRMSGCTSIRQFLVVMGIGVIVSLLVTNLVASYTLWYRTRFCYRMIVDMSNRLYRAYLGQPYVSLLQTNSSVLGKDLLNEVYSFYANALEPLTSMISRSITMTVIVVALAIYDWRAAVFVAVFLGGGFMAIFLLLQRRLVVNGNLFWKATEERYRIAGESLAGIKEVKLFGCENWYIARFADASVRLGRAASRGSVYSLLPRYAIESIAFSLLVSVVIGTLLGGRSLADILPLIGAYAFAGVRLLPALQIVYSSAATVRNNWGATRHLSELFGRVVPGAEAFPSTRPEPIPFRTGVRFENVAFRYPGAQAPVFTGLNAELRAHQCIGITGSSGSGKTTVMDLCMGLLTPTAGRILIDDVPLGEKTRPAWLRNVGYVPQQIYLIDASIEENIAFGISREKIDPVAVARAAKMASMDGYIKALPDGYHTQIGERGVRMSGGQRQRLAIARALYHDPSVLFFDEATSALDGETENVIVESIQSLAQQKTIVIIAHRLSTLRYCDRILQMENGALHEVSYADMQERDEPGRNANGT